MKDHVFVRVQTTIRKVVETRLVGMRLEQVLSCGHIEPGGADAIGVIKRRRQCGPCSAERTAELRERLRQERAAEMQRVLGHLPIKVEVG